MSTVYGDPVDVQARPDGRPIAFAWRDRRYTVRAILEHWVVNRDWWLEPHREPGQPELELWRVTAAAPATAAAVYELRRETVTQAWWVNALATRVP